MTNAEKIERQALVLANLLKDILALSDNAADGYSPLATQARLFKMQATVQRNKSRTISHIAKLTELLDKAYQK